MTLEVDLELRVPLKSRLGVVFGELGYPLPLSIDLPSTGIRLNESVVIEASVELTLGSQIIPLDVGVPLELLRASEGLLVIYTAPVCVEPTEEVATLELADVDPSALTETHRRVVKVPAA